MKWLKKVIKPVVTNPRVSKVLCRVLMRMDNRIDRWLNELLMYAAGGVHPKHRLMSFSQFFLDQVSPEDRVLDIGCGRGTVADLLATKSHAVVAIDNNQKNIDFAKSHYQRPNLRFVFGDALKDLPAERFDVLVLSSVLEHINDRHEFLQRLHPLGNRLLIRVPLITRDWLPMLKKEWGIDYRLDDTHFIEYTNEGFQEELSHAGWKIDSMDVRFGEIWCVAGSMSVSAHAKQTLTSHEVLS